MNLDNPKDPIRILAYYLLHLGLVFAIVHNLSIASAGKVYNIVLHFPASVALPSRMEFFFSHLFLFTFIPCAILAMIIPARYQHDVMLWVWLVPAMIVSYKVLAFRTT